MNNTMDNIREGIKDIERATCTTLQLLRERMQRHGLIDRYEKKFSTLLQNLEAAQLWQLRDSLFYRVACRALELAKEELQRFSGRKYNSRMFETCLRRAADEYNRERFGQITCNARRLTLNDDFCYYLKFRFTPYVSELSRLTSYCDTDVNVQLDFSEAVNADRRIKSEEELAPFIEKIDKNMERCCQLFKKGERAFKTYCDSYYTAALLYRAIEVDLRRQEFVADFNDMVGNKAPSFTPSALMESDTCVPRLFSPFI